MLATSGNKTYKQPGFVQKLEPAPSGAFGEQLGQFIAQPLGGNLQDLRREFADGRESLRLDDVAKSCGKSDGPSQPQFIFGETQARVTNGPDDSRAQIFAAANEVKHFSVRRVHQQSIYGEVAPLHVLLRAARINHMIRVASIGVAHVRTKSGDFNLRAFSRNNHDSEFRAYRQTAGKSSSTRAGTASVATS